MDPKVAAVGDRIRSRIPAGLTQATLADRVDMTPDALSRAMNGRRGFSTIELTDIAHILDVEVHWLITGEPDPHRVSVVARHAWDAESRRRVNPGKFSDDAIVKRVEALYLDAFPEGLPPSRATFTSARQVRDQLGEGFVRRFGELAESELGIDVVRVSGLSTDYSIQIGDRLVIVLSGGTHWYKSNWSLAHELGHIANGHHGESTCSVDEQEGAANAFAADLLLPAEQIRAVDWAAESEGGVAEFLWKSGVSRQALKVRLDNLRLGVSSDVSRALNRSTPQLVGRWLFETGRRTELADRQQDSARRRFPLDLLGALTERVETGQADPEGLAWALDVPVDDIDFPEPESDEVLAARYSARHSKPPSEVVARLIESTSETADG
ncbi:helix-turn-helix domain-containing protein [Gordonia malaquae]|uniref:HTH cro/C1-type domain-containing protein n=1 Tax=Gordonia malaquae NBRC 108250 TaxID=1223542 RepID=M3VC44_GORML|nr:XRE family transcriptional regulator [Gordonia malaquae]GAC81368.1 hypothetical protein GM1_033_00080 [Gordonia malaquae NBRC 108250]